MKQIIYFNIHGDNIVECERAISTFTKALKRELSCVEGPKGSPVCPVYVFCFNNTSTLMNFTLYPGFGRWNEDINQFIREKGGILREAPDVILTKVNNGYEVPIFAIEYCGALAAGNQAWQRNGRAYSFGLTGIPYYYITELGGYELDGDRGKKAIRMPNPAIPFSYLSYSFYKKTPVLPLFIPSPGASPESHATYNAEFGGNDILNLFRESLLNYDLSKTLGSLNQKVFSFVKKRSAQSKTGTTLTPSQWEEAYTFLKKNKTLVDYLVDNVDMSWSKVAYIKDLTDTARNLMILTSKLAIGLTSSSLPFCIIPKNKRPIYSKQIRQLYGNLTSEFLQWLSQDKHLVICWLMGFKPGGDDARPDRGLTPFTRMLIDEKHDLLTVVYGPAPAATWPLLQTNPVALATKNGLWEAIMAASNALLIDSSTDTKTNHGFLKPHWEAALPVIGSRSIMVTPSPINIGENDVDTVLHNLFSHTTKNIDIFEGMCNPPGGDWSGCSLLTANKDRELRWLSLPRVSGPNTKRPDHVFQLFGIQVKPIIFSIESKETASSVEKDIGPKLSNYICNLINSTASVERESSTDMWTHSNYQVNVDDFIYASGVAFISNTDTLLDKVLEKAKADVMIVCNFSNDGSTCEIRLLWSSDLGRIIAEPLSNINGLSFNTTVLLGQ